MLLGRGQCERHVASRMAPYMMTRHRHMHPSKCANGAGRTQYFFLIIIDYPDSGNVSSPGLLTGKNRAGSRKLREDTFFEILLFPQRRAQNCVSSLVFPKFFAFFGCGVCAVARVPGEPLVSACGAPAWAPGGRFWSLAGFAAACASPFLPARAVRGAIFCVGTRAFLGLLRTRAACAVTHGQARSNMSVSCQRWCSAVTGRAVVRGPDEILWERDPCIFAGCRLSCGGGEF